MVSAREAKELLRTKAAAELKAREKVVLSVIEALERRARAVQHLAKVEQDVGTALQAAGQTMSWADLASLTGASQADLRRLARAATDASSPAESVMPAGAGDAPADDGPDSHASAAVPAPL